MRKYWKTPVPVSNLCSALDDKQAILDFLVSNGIPTIELAEDLYHWANTAFQTEGRAWGGDVQYRYIVADAILAIYEDGRFTFTNCVICNDKIIITTLIDDEVDMFDDLNQPTLDETWSEAPTCADCQAALGL